MQNKKAYVEFTKEMKKDYTILIPNMLPMHFDLIKEVFDSFGYHFEVLSDTSPDQAEIGLKYCHNDTCYPAICVIGQFMKALLSGKYDLHKTALIMFQTGGGCRASNYISLIRKALKKANMEYIPVISFSPQGIEKHSGFDLGLKEYECMAYAALYADLIMTLYNQCRTYEVNKGESLEKAHQWTKVIGEELGKKRDTKYSHIKENYRKIIQDFATIQLEKFDAPKVGVVGEIFVKYSATANNNLEEFLVKEGAEVNVPGLIDFLLYYVYNAIEDNAHKGRWLYERFFRFGYRFIYRKRDDISDAIRKEGSFRPLSSFDDAIGYAKEYLNTNCKMGEGWLLTAEMLELYHGGFKNIVCTQPFGCLPNHICGKGMMKPLKEKNPDINIVAIDYDAGASRINQENRLKLMLANARDMK